MYEHTLQKLICNDDIYNILHLCISLATLNLCDMPYILNPHSKVFVPKTQLTSFWNYAGQHQVHLAPRSICPQQSIWALSPIFDEMVPSVKRNAKPIKRPSQLQ